MLQASLALFACFKAPPPSTFYSFDAVAIRTTNLALSDFGGNTRPGGPIRQKPCYRVVLYASHMIEFENPDIYVTAVNAGMVA